MRTFGFSIVFFLLLTGGAAAQLSPDCRNAVPICADRPTQGSARGFGMLDFDPELVRQSGCLEKGGVMTANIEYNSAWYVFRASQDGQIGFNIEALPLPGETEITADWDFAVYGPDVECVVIGSGHAEPIRCNFESNDTGFTGLGRNPQTGEPGKPFVVQSRNTYDDWLHVKTGEVYYILINNWNTDPQDRPQRFRLTFTGDLVDADPGTALDCTLRDEFLGRDISGCVGDPSLILSARNSPAGSNIASVRWSVDYEDDGIINDPNLVGLGPLNDRLRVTSQHSGRYFVEIIGTDGQTYTDDILIHFFSPSSLREVIALEDIADNIVVEIIMTHPDSRYEYAINGGDFQDSPIFGNVPPGENTVIINDKYGCGTTDEIPFLVIGYPKFFTPNGDGVHDTWHFEGISFLMDLRISIFDRYGKFLTEISGTTPGWDGTYKGKPMPASDYWFRMDYSRASNSMMIARSVRSHFTLKR